MTSFIAVLQFIAAQIQLWMTLDPDELGVRIRWGKKVTELKPGIHYMIPFIDSIRVINSAIQVVDLPDQSLDTSDKISVIISGSIEYQIVSALQTLIIIQDFDDSLVTYANGIIAGVVAAYEYADLDVGVLQSEIYQGLTVDTEPSWGIKITAVYITSFTKNRVIRLLR